MLAPISWLKEYIDIRTPTKELAIKLTELGLTCEKIIKEGSDEILELEITPNRPDWLSILGVSKEIAALEGKKVKVPSFEIPKPKKEAPINIVVNYELCPRLSGIIIENVIAKQSSEYIQERLKKIGLRPINNLVDITNYVMFEYGIPIHVFDYDKIKGQTLNMDLAKGGEEFESLDGLKYKLPKNAVIFKDKERIIDLCGIKGGLNSAVESSTKNIFIIVPIYDPVSIRKTSKALALRSDASAIYERGANPGGTVKTLERVVQLVLEEAGGEVASNLIDLKEKEFNPWTINLRLDFTEKLLGLKIPTQKIIEIFESLGLTVLPKENILKVTIPTVRGDLKLEEDLIEEISRLYGYNNFPKTMPSGQIPTQKIPYYNDYKIENFIKNYLVGCGFSEINSYSLGTSGEIKIINPVSLEFEYLRSSLKPVLLKAVKENKANFENISLFEIGKIYKKPFNEIDNVSGIINKENYFKVKGIVEELLSKLHVEDQSVIEELTPNYFSLNLDKIKQKANIIVPYKKISSFPPIFEDLSLESPAKTSEIISLIKSQSDLVVKIDLLDRYQNSRTFRITYQSMQKSLTDIEVAKIREEIIKSLEKKLQSTIRK